MKILVLIYFAVIYSNTVYAKQTVTFISYNYFLNEEDKSMDDERYLSAITQKLSDTFIINHYTTNVTRMLKKLLGQSNVCSFNILKTSLREKQFIFSAIPSSMFIQRKLFALKETLQYLPDKVSILNLLAQKHTFAILSSTSYQELDRMLAMYEDQIMPITGANNFSRLAKLLLYKRVDFIIDYDFSVKNFLTAQQYTLLDSRKIKEYPEFNTGYFACSRTTIGKKVINQIDKLMQSKKIFQAIEQYHYASLPPQIAKKVMAIYKTHYENNIQIK